MPPALDRLSEPVGLPAPDVAAGLPVIPPSPFMPDALGEAPPGMDFIPDGPPWDPDIPPMPDIPDRTPNPSTPKGRVAGMLDIPLPPPMPPAPGRVPGVIVPIPDGFDFWGGPADRSPIPDIPPCCAKAGVPTIVRIMVAKNAFDQHRCCRIREPSTCFPA